MSYTTLREAIRQHEAAHPPSPESYHRAHELVRMVQIHLWNGEQWVLPWAHLVSACHQGSGESEQLVLMFAHHEVVLQGAHLALLLSEIASFHVDRLNELPENFRAQTRKGAPFISRISVRPLTDSGETERMNSPMKEGAARGIAGVLKNTTASALRLDFPELRPAEQHKIGQTCSLG
jgi:hypothetical protein